MGPLWVSSARFLLAFLVAFPFIRASKQLRVQATRQQFLLAAIPGFLIGGSLLLQTYGLESTSVTKSGFITCLYVVFVPLLEWGFLGKRVHWAHAAWVCVALAGAALICRIESGDWTRGDAITLCCAFVAALHIISLEIVTRRIHSAIVYNVFQAFWAGLLPLFFAWRFDRPTSWPLPHLSIVGIAILTFASTLIAFLVQVRSQRVLAPSLVSMLFLLESPFAAFFGFLFFGERLSILQWTGALLILTAATGTIRLHSRLEAAKVSTPLSET